MKEHKGLEDLEDLEIYRLAIQHQDLTDKIVHLNKKLNNYINWLDEQIKNNKDKPNPQSLIPNP